MYRKPKKVLKPQLTKKMSRKTLKQGKTMKVEALSATKTLASPAGG
jgi:hypothetical protein